ncbi:uncharacterized protein LOC126317000 [Schistocerca gregaria]|uniref:uncharacterized protein LOC126317000 n=1 Tax=Schistocerca gregaria TaxID=7010 RepID=UPI00211F3260|nr:uncharacterized protein LOC126317000 [Schistocerca gregaria]
MVYLVPSHGLFEPAVLPPPIETLFDESTLEEEIGCVAIKCPKVHTQTFIRHFKNHLFSREDCVNVPWLIKERQDGGDDTSDESIIVLNSSAEESLQCKENSTFIEASNGKIISPYKVKITFDQRPVHWILHKLIPNVENITWHFETVGHIIHLNLRERDLDYKYIIGAVLLRRNRSTGIRTVINKVGIIENDFRVLTMELLAGEPCTLVQVREGKCVFEFDFSRVFWNSRLQGEHTRIVRLISANAVVCDVFAGVGPFAIPLAKKGATVHANDLNPDSYSWMKKNAKINLGKKINNLTCYCMDGRDFCRELIARQQIPFTDIIMNLPKLAPEFCDVFINLFPKNSLLPRVHLYCFSSGETQSDLENIALKRIENALCTQIDTDTLNVLKIRQTSVNVFELYISFVIPQKIAYLR